MRLSRLGLTVAACTLAASSASGQAPAGYHVGAFVAIPDTLLQVFGGGRFRATVLRSAKTPKERELLSIAERLYPDAETLLATARDSSERNKLAAMAQGTAIEPYKVTPRVAGTPSDRWWLDNFDATWLPFAVTGGAVDYYLGRLRDFASGRGQFGFSPTDGSDHGAFDYQATVRPGSEVGIAYVVDLRVSWNYACGYMCAVSFTHTRTVWFDAQGKVVRVAGDGQPEVIVS